MASDKAVIGRIYAVAPRDIDRFYLRMLLLKTPNVHDYVGPNGLKRTDDDTWRGAAEQRGLVETDEEFDKVLCEAALTHGPKSLRDLFVQVLIHGEVSPPLALWTKHGEDLSHDHLGRARTHAAGLDAALYDIDLLLQNHGKRATDYGLPEPTEYDAAEFTNPALRQALAFCPDEEIASADLKVPMLNPIQRTIFDAVVAALGRDDLRSGDRAFFVDGPGGSGKTFLYEALIHYVRGQSKIALACAISGIAGTLLPGGPTAHALFGLPLGMPSHDAVASIRAQEGRAT